MSLVYVQSNYLRSLEKDEAKIKEIGRIMSDLFGETYRGENPGIDRIFDLIDDLLGVTGKDRCDYVPDNQQELL